MICQRFRIIALLTFWDVITQDIWNICLQTCRNSLANRRILTTWSYINLVISIAKLLLEIFSYFTCDFNNIIVRGTQDISRFFDRSSKKRDLSNNSNDSETSKKPWEGSLNTSSSNDIPDDLFTESLKDPDCVTLLLNCIKKMEKQITQIFDNTNELKEKQIKDKSHPQELSDATDFINKELINTSKKQNREKKS